MFPVIVNTENQWDMLIIVQWNKFQNLTSDTTAKDKKQG